MKKLEKSIKPGNYKTLWIAGKSSALVEEVEPIKTIVDRFKVELNQAFEEFPFFGPEIAVRDRPLSL